MEGFENKNKEDWEIEFDKFFLDETLKLHLGNGDTYLFFSRLYDLCVTKYRNTNIKPPSISITGFAMKLNKFNSKAPQNRIKPLKEFISIANFIEIFPQGINFAIKYLVLINYLREKLGLPLEEYPSEG